MDWLRAVTQSVVIRITMFEGFAVGSISWLRTDKTSALQAGVSNVSRSKNYDDLTSMNFAMFLY